MPKSKGPARRGTRPRGKADERVLRIAMGAMGAGLMVGAIVAPAKSGDAKPARPPLRSSTGN